MTWVGVGMTWTGAWVTWTGAGYDVWGCGIWRGWVRGRTWMDGVGWVWDRLGWWGRWFEGGGTVASSAGGVWALSIGGGWDYNDA